MTTLVTADLHLNDNPRDAYRHDFIADHLPKLIRDHDVRTLAILGDITDDKDHHGAWLTNQVVDHFAFLAERVNIIVVPGNHDYIDFENPFFELLRYVPNIKWFGVPVSYTVDGIRFLFLPHTHNHKTAWEDLNFTKYDYIMCHQTFEGALGDSGLKLKGIPTDVFPKGSRVISGDIHTPQSFEAITYVGAPYTVDFGDDYTPRVLLLNSSAARNQPRSVDCPGPQKRLITLGRDGTGIKGRYNSKDIVKIRVHISAVDHAEWPKIKEEARKWGEAQNLIVHAVVPEVVDKGSASSATRRRAREGAKTDQQLLEQYGKARQVGAETLKTGKEFL